MSEHFDDDFDRDMPSGEEPGGADEPFDTDLGPGDIEPARHPDLSAPPDLTSAGIPEPDDLWEPGDLARWLGDEADPVGSETMPNGPTDIAVSAALNDVPPPPEGAVATQRMIATVADLRAGGDSLDRP
jgi:hypothetical protein